MIIGNVPCQVVAMERGEGIHVGVAGDDMWHGREQVVVVENMGGGVGEEEMRNAFEVGRQSCPWVKTKRKLFFFNVSTRILWKVGVGSWFEERDDVGRE